MERISGAEAEREREHRHERERADDASGPASELPRSVEPVPPEDEQRHEHQERQPVRLRPPGHAPENAVLVVEPAQDECDVEPEREPRQVEEDERRDARRSARDCPSGAVREDERTLPADVRGRAGGIVGRGGDDGIRVGGRRVGS